MLEDMLDLGVERVGERIRVVIPIAALWNPQRNLILISTLKT
jgi:hypothetical protein